jgi:hypothetical protein
MRRKVFSVLHRRVDGGNCLFPIIYRAGITGLPRTQCHNAPEQLDFSARFRLRSGSKRRSFRAPSLLTTILWGDTGIVGSIW